MNSTELEAQYYSNVISSPDTARIGFSLDIDSVVPYVLVRTRCEPDAAACAHVIKIDETGKVEWRTVVNELNPANDNSLLIRNSVLFISGYKAFYDSLNIFHRVLLDEYGSKLSTEQDTLQNTILAINYGSTLLSDNKLLQFGYSEAEGAQAFIFLEADNNGKLIQKSVFNEGFLLHNIWDVTERYDGSLVFLSEIDAADNVLSEIRYRVDVVTQDNEVRTLYDAGKITGQSGWSLDMIATGDGCVFTLPDEQDFFITNYRKIDLEGNVVWSREYQRALDPHFLDHRELYPCANGDILICGRYGVRAEELAINRSGIITRITADGDVLWQKQYTHQDPVTGEHRESTLMDILEDEQGNIVATGLVRNFYDGVRTSDTWILKVDADGCLGDTGDCGVLVTDVAELPQQERTVSIYPNPLQAGSSLTIANLPTGEYTIDLYDLTGQKVRTQTISAPSTTIDANLPKGLYLVSIPLLQVTQKLYVHE